MTRKDYILIAAALLKSKPVHNPAIDDNAIRIASELQFAASVVSVATALGSDNAAFDRARFLKAAGVQS
jgi:hypothetical protein